MEQTNNKKTNISIMLEGEQMKKLAKIKELLGISNSPICKMALMKFCNETLNEYQKND